MKVTHFKKVSETSGVCVLLRFKGDKTKCDKLSSFV